MMNKFLLSETSWDFSIDIKAAVFSSFEYEDIMLEPLFENKIPSTIFEGKIKR